MKIRLWVVLVVGVLMVAGCGEQGSDGPRTVADCEGRGFHDLGFASERACLQVLIANEGPLMPGYRDQCRFGGASAFGFDSQDECEAAVAEAGGGAQGAREMPRFVSPFAANAIVRRACQESHSERAAVSECVERKRSEIDDRCGDIPEDAGTELLLCREMAANEIAGNLD